MCHESQNQMEELLRGVNPTPTTRGLKLLAMTQDKNFLSLENKLTKIEQLLIKYKENTDEEIKHYKEDTDQKIDSFKEEIKQEINLLKEENKFIRKKNEIVMFFQEHPKIFLIVAVATVFLIGFALGHLKIFDLFKIV